MFAFKSKSISRAPKFVLVVTTLVLLSACASKEIGNASLEPLDMPATDEANTLDTMPTPEPDLSTPIEAPAPAPAPVFKSHRKHKLAKKSHKHKRMMAKKTLKSKAVAAMAQVQKVSPKIEETPPAIGDSTVASAPLAVPPMAPPVPFETAMEDQSQPNWWLAAFVVGGVVALTGLALRVRKQRLKRNGLIFNA